MKNKSTISVAIATYNEANNIDACLKLLTNWVDEIVIYDASSTDDTVKIIKNYKKVKLLNGPNHPIFHLNKNKAIDACTSDWILQLDADERINSSLATEIQQILQKPSSQVDESGFWIPRSNYFLGTFLTKGGQYPDPTIRLYKKGLGCLPAIDVHEQAEVKGKVGFLVHPLQHFADTSFSRYLLRHNRYTTIDAQQLQEEKIQLSFLNFLNFYFFKPIFEFCLIFFRHRGYVDGFPGFVFAFYSALRFPIAYTKYYELIKTKSTINLQKDWD
ncbi:glycosyltransferase family 2 protein [Candidatus Shapirobacteria bacterium]|nr:glycosyltransferase family 2 protein [Candidatus Shapirobacteria bacterium]